ncbi:S100P-binding protein-like isoform X1 [Sebastes umbrosus]|uniref:S100P-binding protein-like isoform X1 n=1 Tax=Sebastes umbrosus TaxID=72105 RepID=UPI00189EABFB|nr:S100P-binding protein-like isoform X1 [Sebastes umbrosus]
MDKKDSPTKSIFSRLDPANCQLKPLSDYSRMITCEQKATLHHQRNFSNPFRNFKIEIVNNCVQKRKLEDSNSDEGYETPAKKACSPKDVSPDLGCFMDYCSPPAQEDSVSPFAFSVPALLDEASIRSEIKGSVSSQLHSEHVECGSSTEPGLNKETVPHSLRYENVLLNLAPAFDCDVDNILCLNPLDKVEICGSPSSNTFQNNLCPIVSGPVLESHNPPVEHLEGDVEETWTIGSPVFESSMFQVTLGGEEDTLDTSYESTLPLQVKVKSVVVVPNQHTTKGETEAPPLPEKTKPTELRPDEKRGSATVISVRSQRPVIKDCEREKRLYVSSVTRHMKENGANQGVMTELQNLMTHVADQTQGADGRQWQHPSDFTRRNYQGRFGNGTPRMTLNQWQSKNMTHKRFARVRKCPFP